MELAAAASKLCRLRTCPGHLKPDERAEERRDGAADRLAFEEAAAQQRRVNWLDRLEYHRPELDRPEALRSWLIVLPAARDGNGILLPVARGRVLPRTVVDWADPEWESAIEDVTYAVRVVELRVEATFPPSELMRSLIVCRWITSGAEDGLAFDLRDVDAADVRRTLRRTLGSGKRAACRSG